MRAACLADVIHSHSASNPQIFGGAARKDGFSTDSQHGRKLTPDRPHQGQGTSLGNPAFRPSRPRLHPPLPRHLHWLWPDDQFAAPCEHDHEMAPSCDACESSHGDTSVGRRGSRLGRDSRQHAIPGGSMPAGRRRGGHGEPGSADDPPRLVSQFLHPCRPFSIWLASASAWLTW